MKKAIIFAISLIFSIGLNAQEALDVAILKCKYTFSHIVNVPDNKGYSEVMILEVGKNICSFYCEKNRVFDSIVNTGALDYMFDTRSINVSQLPKRNINLETKLYFNLPTDKITVQDAIFTNSYEYIEDIEKIDWKIYPNETRKILGYNCKKATCRFRGRDYEVWYATLIPISRGPWKFSGLPGLILAVSDSQNQIQFECTEIRITSVPIVKYASKIDDRATKVERKEFLQLQRKFYENPATALGGVELTSISDENGNPVSLPKNRPYNPIELE